MMKTLLAAIVLLFVSHLPQVALAEDVVSGFVGEWTGNGVVRPNGFDQPEKIRCKVVGTKMSAIQISFEGQCATTSGSGSFRLLLAQDPTGQAFAATVRFSTNETEHGFSGSKAENSIILVQKTPVKTETRLVSSTITLNISDANQIEMVNLLKDLNKGTEVKSLSILYRRQ